ncbi:hypothetical protein BWQ96_00196 [Gracilariopsis chorda]|uniref:Uncharacterized protein n=1 Tax=Gracilariopsis chorda TaxID=448386 RepID=A0A2V3J6I2_9FLOR|nr:hypothetical protein BWQ96_00196 [Gracilariopsis chorda]|eukprot:PXF50036.1 hypothetical protein BWQ96_00196 [Gracilariopsis chorda]
MSHENANDLLELMEKAFPTDTILSPRTFSTANPSKAAAIAIGGQLDGVRQNYPLHTGQATPALDNLPPLANSIVPAHQVPITTGPLAALFAATSNPVSNPVLDNGISDEDDEGPPKKR